MNRTSLPINEIVVPERFRKDLGDTTLLEDSIRRSGLIQPIVVSQDKVLIAGGRRLHCHIKLGLPAIDVVYKETLSEADRQEMEAVENIVRKQFTWTEETLAIAKIHQQHLREAALNGTEWNTRLACELFGISKGALGYVLVVAKRLEAELSLPEDKRKYHQFSSCFEAYRLGILGEIADAGLALLAKKHTALANTTNPPAPSARQPIEDPPSVDDLSKERAKYEENPLNTVPFEEYWEERKKTLVEREVLRSTVYLSNRILLMDSIDWMNENQGMIDHIITDIPYGIDLEMMNQVNVHGGLKDLETVEDEHDVKENMDLMCRFFRAAFHCTKEKAFVITYLDIMQWQYCYDLAVETGFKVQRWPYIWHKQSGGQNNCAYYNTTKNYDVIMICRKPGITLITPITSSIHLASHEAERRTYGHVFSKPSSITKTLAEAISLTGSLFLDPFAGRGSIAIELMKLQRRVVAIEKQDDHYNALLENTKRFYLSLNPNTTFL